MQKITPFLWFDNQAEAAAQFYTQLFKNSSMGAVTHYPEGSPGGAAGTVMTVSFSLDGTQFAAINAGPIFKPNPSVSFYVTCSSAEEVENYRNALIADGGASLMELGKYDWSEKYGWVVDKFGISWQLFV